MKAVIQRVLRSSVTVGGESIAQIGRGLAVLLGVEKGDTENQADYLADRIAGIRIFEDECGKMNLSVRDVGGEALVVSQFTLAGDCRKGRRPGFDNAAPPEDAKQLYERFTDSLRGFGVPVKTGRFQAEMLFSIENDGPVTFVLESREVRQTEKQQ